MASRTDKQPIVPGALNLLTPGDKIPAGGSLLLDNWRVDQFGQLRSRLGTSIQAAQIGSGVFHTIARAAGDRYCGVGNALYWGDNAQTEVASGFDGNPLGIVFYDQAGWVMNTAKQLRLGLNGAGSTPWGVGAPATAPTATAGAQQYSVVEGFEQSSQPAAGIDVGYYDSVGIFHDEPTSTTVLTSAGTIAVTNGSAAIVGTGTAFTQAMVGAEIEITGTLNGVSGYWLAPIASVTDATHASLAPIIWDWDTASGLSFQITTQVPAASADTTNFQQVGDVTASLQVNASVVGTWAVTDDLLTSRGGAIDTTTEGVAQDDDVFRLWVYCSNPAAVASFAVVLLSGSSDTAGLSAYVTMPGSVLNQTPNSWTLLQILRNINLDSWNAAINAIGTVPVSPGFPEVQSANPAELAALIASFSQRTEAPHFTEVEGGKIYTGMTVEIGGNQEGGSGYTNNGQVTAINWSAISGLQVLVNLTAPCVFNLDNSYFVGTVQGVLTGTGNYFVSYANQWDEDGDLSPMSNTVTCVGQSVELTNIPVSPDPQVTQRWIWRVGFGSSQALQVGQINDNVTTFFVDAMSVVAAQDEGLVAPTARTQPPPAAGVMGPYLSQLMAWNWPGHPCRYGWTEPGIPWAFPGWDDVNGNWEDAGSDDDPLLMITNHQLMALFYKTRSLGRLYGSPDTADYQEVDQTCGLVGPKAVVNGGQVDYFMGPEGIYYRNYDSKVKISTDIDPIFKGDYVQLSTGEFIPPISKTWIGLSVLELCNDRLYVSYVEEGASLPTMTLICQLPGQTAITDVPTYRWSRMYVNPAAVGQAGNVGFTALHYDGNPYRLMGGVTGNWVSGDLVESGGYLLNLEFGDTNDSGETVHVAWQSRFSDQGLPDNLKYYSDLELDAQTAFNGDGLSTLSVYIVYNHSIKVLLGTFTSAVQDTQSFPLMGIVGSVQHPQGYSPYDDLLAKNAAIRVEGDIGSTCIIYGAYLHWYPQERLATTFDSGFIDLGLPERVKQADYLEFVATGIGQQVTRALYSDLPGSVLTEQASLPVTLPNGRGNVRARLPAILEGRNLRVMLSNPLGSQAFQIHAARLRQRVIGEYIDGTIGEYFESPEFSVAPGRDGELKDLLLDYDSETPGGQLVLYADSNPPEAGPPALTVARTLQIPTGTRRTFSFPFEDLSNNLPYGTLFKIRVIPPAGGIIRLHGRATIRARIIGVCFDGAAGEIWLTQPLDLFGGIGVFREIAVVAQTLGPMTLTMSTELPGAVMAPVASFPVNSTNATSRLPVYARLPGTTKGQLQQFQLSGAYWARLFEVKVLGRGLGNSETAWQWVKVPLEETSNEWREINMPVRATPEEFTWVDLPVDAIE
jgi:hypothetical protein